MSGDQRLSCSRDRRVLSKSAWRSRLRQGLCCSNDGGVLSKSTGHGARRWGSGEVQLLKNVTQQGGIQAFLNELIEGITFLMQSCQEL